MKTTLTGVAIVLLAVPIFCFTVVNLPGFGIMLAMFLAAYFLYPHDAPRVSAPIPFFVNSNFPGDASAPRETEQDKDAEHKQAA